MGVEKFLTIPQEAQRDKASFEANQSENILKSIGFADETRCAARFCRFGV